MENLTRLVPGIANNMFPKFQGDFVLELVCEINNELPKIEASVLKMVEDKIEKRLSPEELTVDALEELVDRMGKRIRKVERENKKFLAQCYRASPCVLLRHWCPQLNPYPKVCSPHTKFLQPSIPKKEKSPLNNPKLIPGQIPRISSLGGNGESKVGGSWVLVGSRSGAVLGIRERKKRKLP